MKYIKSIYFLKIFWQNILSFKNSNEEDELTATILA